jgi:hypothetical protein
MCPSVQGGTQQLMDRSGEHLAVLVRKAPEIRQEARRPSGRTSTVRAEVSQQRIHGVVRLSVWRIVAGTGGVPYLVNGPVQLGLSLLQRLQRAILLQRDHNRFDLTSADDHLMISNLVAGGNGTLTHAQSIPRQLVPMTDPLTPP